MHVFVWEALVAGCRPDLPLPESLLGEGRAMLEALIEDLLRINGCRVSTIRHADHPLQIGQDDPALTIHECSTPHEEAVLFERLASRANACWIIAPETHGLLAERCRRVESLERRLVVPSSSAAELCGDKLKLAQLLQQHGLPTIATEVLNPDRMPSHFGLPVVVKPRIGAGSDMCRVIRSLADWTANSPQFRSREFLVQPFVCGTPASIAVLVSKEGDVLDLLPVAKQRLADDGSLRYLGGEITNGFPRAEEIERLVSQACRVIQGLRGYVGFDLIVPDDNRRVLLVEVNPRLTTSYVGYRRLTADNIAERVLAPQRIRRPITWRPSRLRFFPDGRCIEEHAERPRTQTDCSLSVEGT